MTTKATSTTYYAGGRITEVPDRIQGKINFNEEAGWRVQQIIMGMGGMWVVYEKEQK